jgi:hypothetical protein
VRRPKRKTAAEFAQELERDPSYVAARAERERAVAQQAAAVAADEAGLLADLRSAAVHVGSVYDFVNDTPTPVQAVPILFAHILKPHHPRVREGALRALAYSHLRDVALGPLKELFTNATDPSERWLIANSLAAMASRKDLADLRGIQEYSNLFKRTPGKRRRTS